MREPKNQMLGTMEPPLMQLSAKGVLHPWPVLWLFIHFSQKLQHIGNK